MTETKRDQSLAWAGMGKHALNFRAGERESSDELDFRDFVWPESRGREFERSFASICDRRGRQAQGGMA